MSPDETEFSLVVACLHQWCFGRIKKPNNIPLELMKKFHLERFCYYYGAAELEPELRFMLRKEFQQLAAQAIQREMIFQQLTTILTRERITFCPFKGIDLAYRCYPVPALRPMCDIDLLVQPEMCERLLVVLQENGWLLNYQYDNSHHLPVIQKNGISLEVHFCLPQFHIEDMPSLWKLLVPEEGHQISLPPELNLLMLFNHSWGHGWSNGIHLLTDVGYLFRQQAPNWNLVMQYTEKFHVKPPQILFEAFEDFFPQSYQPPYSASPQNIRKSFRQVLSSAWTLTGRRHELLLNSSESFRKKWWKERLYGLRPQCLRIKYSLPPDGAYGSISKFFFLDLAIKGKTMLYHFFRKPDCELEVFLNSKQALDQYLQHGGFSHDTVKKH